MHSERTERTGTMSENKEKFYDNTEKLSTEELDGVSGGNCDELSGDSDVLKSLGLCNSYSYFNLLRCPGHCQEIVNGWAKAGVECKFDDLFSNEYFIDGKKVSRGDAINYVKKKYGK